MLYFLSDLLPKNVSIDGRYIEPFVGGGSMFLHVRPKEAIISDLNKDLIDLYRGIKNYPHKVWRIFADFPSGKEAYYSVRDTDYLDEHLSYRAARTLYLNRTCFKGMWRHNPRGEFNVGYGGDERRWAITYGNIVGLSNIFKQATIEQSDFGPILDKTCDGDFIFLDPPYKPGSKEMFEAHYINGKFSFEDQRRLSIKLRAITETRKIKWMMTNSSHPEICKLYKNFNIRKIPKGVSDTIGVQTQESNEVVISNY